MEINITILQGTRPPPTMVLTASDNSPKSIESAIPENLKPGYLSKSNMWGLVWIVKEARCFDKVEEEKPKKKRKKRES